MYKRKKDQLYYTNRHSCFLLQYHMVLATKYRKPVLQGKVKESVYNIIKDLCDERGYRILEINGEPDHVHLLFETGPDMSPMEFANVVKTKTARFTRRDYPKGSWEILLETVFLDGQLFCHDCWYKQSCCCTGLHKKPVAFIHHHAERPMEVVLCCCG